MSCGGGGYIDTRTFQVQHLVETEVCLGNSGIRLIVPVKFRPFGTGVEFGIRINGRCRVYQRKITAVSTVVRTYNPHVGDINETVRTVHTIEVTGSQLCAEGDTRERMLEGKADLASIFGRIRFVTLVGNHKIHHLVEFVRCFELKLDVGDPRSSGCRGDYS